MLPIFLATFALAAAAFIVWGFGMLTDWHWGPYCSSSDNCSGWPDMGGVYNVSIIFGALVAAGVVGLMTPGRPRALTIAMLPLAAAAVVFFLVPEVRELLFP